MIYCDILQYKATNAEPPYKAGYQQVQAQPEPYITYNISMLTKSIKMWGRMYCNTKAIQVSDAAAQWGNRISKTALIWG